MSNQKRAKTLDAFVNTTNTRYDQLHRAYEEQFWGTKMGLKEGDYSKEKENACKESMEAFLRDPELLAEVGRWREELKGISAKASESALKCLDVFERTVNTYAMSDARAIDLRKTITAEEGKLEEARAGMKLGYQEAGGQSVCVSSVGLRNTMRTHADEAIRKSCYDSLVSIGPFINAHGFPEVVKKRNRMARMLGYVDFYDYKVTLAEGFGKDKLFEILDTLETATRPIMDGARASLEKAKGKSALEPWNISHAMSGDVTTLLDPYFPFEKAVERWGRSFAKMGISYGGALMNLDLLDRPGKYSNGFCHWPQCAWVQPDGKVVPSQANFTSLADPAAVGSGRTALTTLMHEAGHAAHFANIQQPSPLFAQERAPTSVAYAENQSMFLDSLVGDAGWMGVYARDREDKCLPWDIIEAFIKQTHPYEVFQLRAMLSVPYFEKALYEMNEEDVTAESIIALANKIEQDIQGGNGPRPLLSVPHIISDEASCYYHGYVLAEMSVHQTRAHFLEKYGKIVDNPAIGKDLAEVYWVPGNSRPFLALVKELTGTELTGKAWVDALSESLEVKLESERRDYDEALVQYDSAPFGKDDDINLGMVMRMVDGDTVLADSDKAGGFLQACKQFEEVVSQRAKAAL